MLLICDDKGFIYHQNQRNSNFDFIQYYVNLSSTASFTKVLGIEEGIKCLTDVSFEQYRHLLFALSEDVNDDDNDSDSDNDNEGRSYSFSCYNIHS